MRHRPMVHRRAIHDVRVQRVDCHHTLTFLLKGHALRSLEGIKVESISAESLESIESSGTTETIAVTAPASFKGVNRLAVQKSGRRSKYKLSTGYISKEWALWWLTEFFGSDNFRNTLTHSCWMKIDGHWIPCVAVLDDDVSLYDRTKKDMIRIDFTVHLALDGFI